MGSMLFAMAMVTMMSSGAAPTDAEFADAKAWAAAKFEGKVDTGAVAPSHLEVVANNDPVQANGRGGKPMHIVDKEYARGLYCHAYSKVVVRLDKPAQKFDAIVGIDTNDQTSGGRGSVVFRVLVGEKELWHSDVMREGMAGVPVSVELGGVRDFVLEIDQTPDGIACDQSDWAEAQVTFQDGQKLGLGELPIQNHVRTPYNADPFISFVYGGKPSSEFLASWKLKRSKDKLDDARTQHTLTYTDPETKLEVRCVGIAYNDFPTVEWTVYFKNASGDESPILSDIQAIDTVFDRADGSEYVLNRHTGDLCTADSFQPRRETLEANKDRRITNTGGRPTQTEFPYFNLEAGQEGLIFVVSWAGQWSAQFTRDPGTMVRLKAGQELTHFKLLPGEEVRTPMIVLQFWKGERMHAQNVWRSWMIAHNMPRPGGKLPPVPESAACSSHQFGEMINANTENQKFFIDKYLERGLTLDYWWMDAGWYVNETGWPNTGTWEVDTKRFPGGLRPICDHAHSKGVKTIVWFEPERVTPNTWLTNNHPEWILGGANGGLLNLGNPDAWKWLTNHIDGLITSEAIDLYRQDFNMDPLGYWRGNDVEDRQGITEIRHVEGYLAYWDYLRERHPDMLIDSCASGGRRNDLETLRRAVPLLRSDYIMEPTGNQAHTYALSLWFPFYGTGTSKADPYLIRSTLCPHFTACWDMRDDSLDYARIKTVMDQWKAFSPCFLGDYYPLMPYSLSEDLWIAWQFNRDDLGQGFVQAFRRPQSVYESLRLKLFGLDPQAKYTVQNVDETTTAEYTGQELMERGFLVQTGDRPAALVFTYKKAG